MRSNWRKQISLLCAVLGLSVGAAGAQEKLPAPIPKTEPLIMSSCEDAPLSEWYTQAGAVILHRSVGSQAILITNPAGTAVLNRANDFNFSWDAGPQVLVGKKIDDCTAIEAGYFGLYNMHAALNQAGPGTAPGSPFAGVNFFADYHSTMNSVELNFRRWVSCDLSIFAGVRYVNWHEDLDGGFVVPGRAAIVPPPGVAVLPIIPAVPAFPAFTSIVTNNNLFGAQVGGDWQTSIGERAGIGAFGKAGLYGNEAYARATAGPVIATASGVRGQVAFLGELGVIGTYKATDSLTLRAGYTVMWIEGIALAPDQLANINFANRTISVDSHGGSFLHGAIVGAEFRW